MSWLKDDPLSPENYQDTVSKQKVKKVGKPEKSKKEVKKVTSKK